MSKTGSFGARPCTSIRRRLFEVGEEALPASWRRSWIIARIKATPPWADFKAIRWVYAEAGRVTLRLGAQYVVDHIIPLQHPAVCGLHVAWNLRAVPFAVNAAKHNAWHPDQLELGV